MPTSEELLRLKLEEERVLKEKIRLRDGLPHLYGMPWYEWAYDFFKTENKEAFLCAANQVSKSSTQIRKFIDWATDTSKWKSRWPSLFAGQIPNQFWYLYPNADVATIEFETKWLQFLPKNNFKEHEIYGWEDNWSQKHIKSIVFNSGVTIYFKSYSQKSQDLQSGSVFMLGADEELPIDLLPELQARLNGTDGYLSGVFTATLGQDYWRRVISPQNAEEELHKDAWKKSISLYDSQVYRDGSPSPWTDAKIKRAIDRCPTKADFLRRIMGQFAVSSGRKCETFERDKNMAKSFQIPPEWNIYSGVDIGSGGENGHPGAITFIAVRPDYQYGVVFRGWRGDGVQTTASDIFLKHSELKGKIKPVSQVYDSQAKDFDTIATRNNDPFTKAKKGQDIGDNLMNVLFKHQMLSIFEGDSELEKLAIELVSVLVSTTKAKAKDDFYDSCRFAAMEIPWDFSAIDSTSILTSVPENKKTPEQEQLDERRAFVLGLSSKDKDPMEMELDEWNSLY